MRRSLQGTVAVVLGSAVACLGCAPARSRPAASDRLTAEAVGRNLASFDKIWTTVRDRHWDPSLGGLDWEAVRAELRPKVERARSAGEARGFLVDALARLRQSHFAIVPSEAYGDLPTSAGGGAGTAGLGVRILDGRPTVTAVLPGGPADRAGVLPGWVLLEVAGEDTARILAGIARGLPDSPWRRALQALSVEARCTGADGHRLSVAFEDGSGQEVARTLVLDPPTGTPARLGWLPTQYLRFDARELPGGAGYVHFNVFLDPPTLLPAFEEALARFRRAPGLVLDLRGNTGGIGLLAMGMGGWFVTDRDRELGSMITREGTLRFVLNPRAPAFEAPVAALVDEVSISTAEILAGGLQDLGRVRVFGSPSAGAALPSAIERLPNGDGFQYAIANYVRAGGEPLEGRGVIPDVEAPLTREALLAGRDPALEAALTWIRSQADP